MEPIRKWIAYTLASIALASTVLATDATAQDWPTRPVRIVVGYPPGGGTDVLARAIGEKLSAMWGQPVIVDNRPGASGIVGADAVAKSAPDGYTLIFVVSSHAVNDTLYAKVPYRTERDFVPVAFVGSIPNILVVRPTLPVNSVAEFVAYAKANPRKLNYASGGLGISNHLTMERFKLAAGIDIVHIPFKGGAPSLAALLGGQVDVMFNTLSTTLPHVQSGALRALAVTSARRSPLVPDVPTLIEAGFPEFEASEWWGILAPAGTPPGVVDKINASVTKVIESPEMQEKLVRKQGLVFQATKPADFAKFLNSESVRWGQVIKAANIEQQ